MRAIFVTLFCVFSLAMMAQNEFTNNDAKAVIDTFFKGFHAGDTITIRSVLAKDVLLQTASANASGENVLSTNSIDVLIKAVSGRPNNQKWEEKLLDYKMQIDGNLAHVWTPYKFWVDGKFSHCGANSFTLAKIDTSWKIVHIIDSRRRN